MHELKTTLDELTAFGVKPHVGGSHNPKRLRFLLARLYSYYLEDSYKFDKKSYNNSPEFDYDDIRKNVESNFTQLGLYHSLYESHKTRQEADVVLGDAVDDLTDIIKDMLNVKWRFENTSDDDALWHFELYMRSHSEQHLVNILKYLKDLLG